MEDQLLTLSVPFEKNVFFGTELPLFAITCKKKEDDIVDHVDNFFDPDYGMNGTTYKEGYVTRIYDLQTGKQLFVLDAVNTGSIKHFLEMQNNRELFCKPDATYKQLRDIYRTFKSGHRIRYKTQVINGILTFRFFYFLPNFFEEGRIEGYHEITRICFKGDECWKENRDGHRYKFDYKYVNYMGTKETAAMSTSSTIFDASSEFHNAIKEAYPDIPCYCYSFRDFLRYFETLYKGEKVNKNTPQCIKEHLKRTYSVNMAYTNKSNIMNDDSGYFINVSTGTNLVCYAYYNKKGINTERLYFTKDRLYRFGYNRYKDCWVSTKKCGMEIMQRPVPDRGKTGTIMDYYCNMLGDKRPTFAQVVMAMESPLIEKLYKVGLEMLVQSSYNRSVETTRPMTENVLKLMAKSINMEYNREEMKNLEPHQLLGISRGYVKYISRETFYGGNLLGFRRVMASEVAAEMFPDMKKRIRFAQVFLRTYGSGDLEFMDRGKIKYIGKIANSGYSDEECNRLMIQYHDYLRIREEAILWNEYLERQNEQDQGNREIFKYPICPKVSEITFLHNKAARDASYYHQIKDKEKLKIQDDKIKEFVTSKEYQNLLYENNTYTLVGPECTESLVYEGNFLHHCVGSYAYNVANRTSYIYFLRKKEDVDTPFFTMEVVRENGEYKLRQCYTFHDKIEKPKSCKSFIENWCSEKKICISCTL